MLITGIEDFDKKRVRVTVDEEISFVLYRGELQDFGITEGQEISPSVYDGIISETLMKRAKLRAMKLLEHRDYTEDRLRRKLEEGGYPEQVTAAAIEYVQGYGYQDDVRYAGDYCRAHMHSKSRRMIEAELINRGIDRDIVGQALEEQYEEEDESPELTQIRTFLSRKQFDPETTDYATRQKLTAALLRKGFPSDLIRSVMGN